MGRKPGVRARRSRQPQRRIDVFGKLTWQAIPFDQPIPLATLGGPHRRDQRTADLGVREGLRSVPLERVDHERRPQTHRHHVLPAGAGDAAAGLQRCPDDAIPTGVGLQCARLPPAGALRPDLLRPRHHHDLLRGHAIRGRPDELRGAPAVGRTRCRVSNTELREFLADGRGRPVGEHIAGGG